MKYAFIRDHAHEFTVTAMCRVLGVCRSGFYAWLKQPFSKRALDDRRLTFLIRDLFELSDQTYGAVRIRDDLRDLGETISKHRTGRLMRIAKLFVGKQRKQPKFVSGKPARLVANQLKQDFLTDGPDKIWVADTTYIRTAQGWLYLCVVIDLWSRMVVGWSMKPRKKTDLAMDAVAMAITNRRPHATVIFHSDQGSEFGSYAFMDYLDDNNISPSMSRRGNCWDNAVAESFFATLKKDRVNRRRYKTRDQAKADLFDYIEHFYNGWRRHSALGNLSPKQFELAANF